MIKLSIIVPTLNEANIVVASLLPLQTWRRKGHEVIIVDGGSNDTTVKLAGAFADHVITSPRGRARQMNAGAQIATGDALLFLHADTLLPDNSPELISTCLRSRSWGRFDLILSGTQPLLRVIEIMINWRSRLSGIASGDQAIFIERKLFETIDGYTDIPIMEDIEICKRLKRHSRPACIQTRLITSSRRWEQNGIINTILLMWRLRLAYFLGVSPKQLVRRYY